ncbi:MAG: hypothetical protein ACJASB_003323, partial [Shewanella psychromarinicola]
LTYPPASVVGILLMALANRLPDILNKGFPSQKAQ